MAGPPLPFCLRPNILTRPWAEAAEKIKRDAQNQSKGLQDSFATWSSAVNAISQPQYANKFKHKTTNSMDSPGLAKNETEPDNTTAKATMNVHAQPYAPPVCAYSG